MILLGLAGYFSWLPKARSRLNTVYMVSYFPDGSPGSYLGAWGWSKAHWNGVCAVGLLLSLPALGAPIMTQSATRRSR